MNNKKNRVGLVDISDKDLQVGFKSVTSKVETLDKELDKIDKLFKGSNAQERLILFDVLTGVLIEMSSMSSFLIISVLTKYITNSVSNRPVDLEVLDIHKKKGIDNGPTNYIG